MGFAQNLAKKSLPFWAEVPSSTAMFVSRKGCEMCEMQHWLYVIHKNVIIISRIENWRDQVALLLKK